MIPLPSGCYISTNKKGEISVFPDNWKTVKGTTAKPWRIQYRFYDPRIKEGPYAKGRLLMIKRMNEYRDVEKFEPFTLEGINMELIPGNRHV